MPRYDGTEVEPQSIEEEAWEQNRVKPKFKERNWDDYPEEEDEHDPKYRKRFW